MVFCCQSESSDDPHWTGELRGEGEGREGLVRALGQEEEEAGALHNHSDKR